MAAEWKYWVSLFIEHGQQRGITGTMVVLNQALNSEEAIVWMIDSLTRAYFTEEEIEQLDEGAMPVVPLSWSLVSARQGPGVKPQDNGQKKPH